MVGLVFRERISEPRFAYIDAAGATCEAMLGYAANELIGKIGLRDLAIAEDAENLGKILDNAQPAQAIFRICTKQGEEKTLWMNLCIIDTDKLGDYPMLEGFLIDITKQFYAKATKIANRAKFNFFDHISHELRTPLNVILGTAEMGLRENMSLNARAISDTIKQVGNRLVATLDGISDYSQIQQGLLRINNEKYSPKAIAEEIAEMARSGAKDAALNLIVDISPNLPSGLLGDGRRIRQILYNLLDNAIKFTDKGHVAFGVYCNIDKDMAIITFAVEDTGRGIKKEDISRIFDEYSQFDSQTFEGNGFGLTIANALARLMGGEISVSSDYGSGSIFTFTLSQPIIDARPGGRIAKIGELTSFIAPEARVLIVDDVKSNLIVAESLLSHYEMRLDLCDSGASAIMAVRENKYDLILLDYYMPVLNGVEVARAIRSLDDMADSARVPIIALSAEIGQEARDMFSKNGFDDFISKPIEASRLYAAIAKWIPARLKIEPNIKITPDEPAENGALQEELKIEGLDTRMGLMLCGGDLNVYQQVLNTFQKNTRKLLTSLRECIIKEDFPLFTIHVHGLKSISASIGSADISAAAKELEKASETRDRDFINAHAPKFMRDLEDILDNIEKTLLPKPFQNIAPRASKKKRVLIIDDIDAFLIILNDILKDDYETLIAKSGEDGLDTARLARPDLILLDVMMPGMGGLAVLEQIRADAHIADTPIILVTGKDTQEDEIRGMSLGANGYIHKPFVNSKVKKAVDSILL